MKKFLNDLEKQAIKQFSSEETKEVVSYYEEIINERLASGEEIESILNDYDINKIIKEMTAEVLSKRDLNDRKTLGKSAWQLLLLLFSVPILIPIAILFLALMITMIAIGVSGLAVLISAVFSVIPYLIEVITYANSFSVTIGLIGIGLFAWSAMMITGLVLIRVTHNLVGLSVKAFSKWVVRKGAKSWEY